MKDPKHKKLYLFGGLGFNIALLGYFKYMDFFISNLNWSLDLDISLLHLALPLAISFYTLQQIAYLVDSYGGLVKEKSFIDYTIFVTFFPQLIAGPIVHHKEMMPQFASDNKKYIDYKNIATGLFIFSVGLFKKVVIADTFASWASAGHANADVLNMLEAWATSLSYTFQLYFDFSGYTDMAIGVALLFNIVLPQNFNSPYKSTGLIEFWQRWHMTLTRFITTYIYKPFLKSLGKVSFEKAMIATIFTMFIAGLWHGAAWTFVIFGILHGLAIAINHYWKKTKIKMPIWFAWFITFNFLNLSFIIFRADSLDGAWKIMNSMFFGEFVLDYKWHEKLQFLDGYVNFGAWLQHIQGDKYTAISIVIGFIITLVLKTNSTQLIKTIEFNKKTLIVGTFMATLALLKLHEVSEFLYFNF
jgi:D-alanyl-lipoteichoic acid acyltransferase DltB (MBOAT superfamily)